MLKKNKKDSGYQQIKLFLACHHLIIMRNFISPPIFLNNALYARPEQANLKRSPNNLIEKEAVKFCFNFIKLSNQLPVEIWWFADTL